MYGTFLRDPNKFKDPEQWSQPDKIPLEVQAMERRVGALDAAIGRAEVERDTVLHRAVDFPLKVGETFTDKSYAAFSGSHEWAEKVVAERQHEAVSVISVKFPKGSHALSLPDSESFEHGKEQEVLAPRNLRFKVTGVHESHGTNYYTAEIE